jgi:hypothetical protein
MSMKKLSLLLAIPLTGCATLLTELQSRVLPEPELELKILGAAPEGVEPLAPDALAVTAGSRELPRGFFYARQPDGRQKIHAAAGFPSDERPNAVIGAFVATLGGRAASVDARSLPKIKERAAALGANHLWQTGARSPVVFALYVSSSDAPAPAGADALLREARAQHDGFRAGTKAARDLSDLDPFFVELKPNRCYVLVAALSGDARLNAAGENMIATELTSDDELLYNKSFMHTEKLVTDDGVELTAPVNGRYLSARSFSHDLGCASGKGEAKVAVRTIGRSENLGEGTIYTQLLEKKVSKREIKTQLALARERRARARAEAERFAAEQRAREAEREAQRARDEARRAQLQASRTSSASSSSSSSGPDRYSFSLKNECRQTVKLFLNSGGNPRFSGGETRTLSANSIQSFSGFGPKTFWIVDDRGEGVSSFTAGGSTRNMRVTSSCSGFAQR